MSVCFVFLCRPGMEPMAGLELAAILLLKPLKCQDCRMDYHRLTNNILYRGF